jgi:hypothetical protein
MTPWLSRGGWEKKGVISRWELLDLIRLTIALLIAFMVLRRLCVH